MKGYIRSKNSVLWGFVALAAGLLIANNSSQFIEFSIRVLGALMVVLGGVELISTLTAKRPIEQKSSARGFTLFGAATATIIGLIILLTPSILAVAFMYVLGIFVVLLGLWQLYVLRSLRQAGAQLKNSVFIFPALLCLSGVIMLFFPMDSSSWIIAFAGYWIAASGLFEIITTIFIKVPKSIEEEDYRG